MDAELNITYLSIDGYVGLHEYRYLYFVIIFTVYILILCCNFTIVYLICKHRSLHEPMYIFIAALLLNAVAFSTNIYPKLLTDILSEKPVIPYPACLLQFFLFYSLGCSEFLLLSAMSYDRYLSICKPLQYLTIMRNTTVCSFLGVAWIVPACLIAVPVILSADMKLCNFTLESILCNNSLYGLQCEGSRARSIFGTVVLIVFALFPMLFILFTYTRILIIAYRSSKEVRRKAAQTCLPHLLTLISFSCLCGYDVIVVRLGSQLPKLLRLIITLQTVMYHPLFNPIIYGLKMTEIAKHLKRLICRAKVN